MHRHQSWFVLRIHDRLAIRAALMSPSQVVLLLPNPLTLMVLGADELAVCRGCYEAAARFGRLNAGHPILFELEQLP
jgi:hypothetical protein